MFLMLVAVEVVEEVVNQQQVLMLQEQVEVAVVLQEGVE